MRSIGATSFTVATQFLAEGWFVGVIAWLIGLPLSLLLNMAIIREFQFEGLPGAGYPPGTVILGLVGTLLVVTVASLWPSLAAARKEKVPHVRDRHRFLEAQVSKHLV